ncbi:uncharacterized protein BO96DRAFT_492662 [Aspergillus niger CBS 101883]|uniref:uncharacterized protein n=1 Tax=Aspergillus lacticoffeatus (strain CBS 101883) TaxID=1450533 RepID=UPI000D7FC6AF|nr:uncharacterized protein BO96DRAFT_492662 [Aspergillus niger CBS 101883]PYH50214.1 hypothetical protein BO96DRAFT_492662 [Aspergillus niger CBS 101883]
MSLLAVTVECTDCRSFISNAIFSPWHEGPMLVCGNELDPPSTAQRKKNGSSVSNRLSVIDIPSTYSSVTDIRAEYSRSITEPMMERCPLVAISSVDYRDTLHIRACHGPIVLMEAGSCHFEVSLEEMKQSVFGCAFLLYDGGFLGEVLSYAIRNWNNDRWNPLAGGEGLRVGGKRRVGMVDLCPIIFGNGTNDSAIVPFRVLKDTVPGRLMLWQAENPYYEYTVRVGVCVLDHQFSYRSQIMYMKVLFDV